jgi:hypothetical protein
MEFLLLFDERRGTPPPEKEGLAAMERYVDELRRRGVFRRGGPLAPAAGAVGVRVRGGEAMVTDGPFAEAKELIAGFWIIEVADRAEAIEICRRCPHVWRGPIELRAVRLRHLFADSGRGKPFLFAFHSEPSLCDVDGAKMREMVAHAQVLASEGKLFETTPLAGDPPAARIEAGAGKVLVTDGPFAEAKEVVGGYSLVRADGIGAAVEMAGQYPHARWGAVEVREILFLDPE